MPRIKLLPEDDLALVLKDEKITGWVRQYKFHPTRKWPFDFAFVDIELAVECEGGVYVQGRHTRGIGFTDDCEKYNEALLLGWRVLRVTTAQVKNGQALGWIKRALE